MRWSLVLVPFFALGCSDGDGNSNDDETSDTDAESPYGDCHPLIGEYLLDRGLDPLDPGENTLCYQLITDTPCTTRNGGTGRRTYRLMDEGRAEADGTFTATERWFFFNGNPDDYAGDHMDLLTYEGAPSTFKGSDLGCVGCEEVYSATRTVVENPSGTPYATDVVFAFDNMNPNGGFQEDNKMFIFYARYTRQGLTDLDTSYARGFYHPDSGNPGDLPADYSWGPFDIQGKCTRY